MRYDPIESNSIESDSIESLWELQGNTQWLDGGAMFGHIPKEMWKRWTTPDEHNRIRLATRCLLIQYKSKRKVLFETGVGSFFSPPLKLRYGVQGEKNQLLEGLNQIGFDEKEIDAIILSHLHFDHAGGLLEAWDGGPLKLAFSLAKIYVGKDHWERAKTPHSRERASFIPELVPILEKSQRLHFIQGKSHPDFDLTFHFSHGHTIGLTMAEIPLKPSLLFVSDLIPGLPWMHLPVTMGYDRFSELIVDEKAKYLAEWKDKRAALFFTHDPDVALASIEQDSKGKFFGKPLPLTSLKPND